MKFIKKYNEVNHQGYKIVSEDEKNKLLYGFDIDNEITNMWEVFTKEEENYIDQFFKPDGWKFTGGKRGYYMANKSDWQYVLPIGSLVSVIKLKDEWYLVQIKHSIGNGYNSMKSYQCDQWDGLVNCLNDTVSKNLY